MSRKTKRSKRLPGRFIGYARVSTGQQDLTRQVRAEGERCAVIFTDTASGKSRVGRPNLAAALANASSTDT